MEDPIYRQLMDYAMRSLARRSHTVHELQTKLRKKPHHTPKYEKQVIDRLKELNLLNDERYLENAIDNAVNIRFHGPYKLAQRLRPKGISSDEIFTRWKALKINDREVAKNALKKHKNRFKRVPKEKSYSRRAQFLASRGFSGEIIFDLAKSDESH